MEQSSRHYKGDQTLSVCVGVCVCGRESSKMRMIDWSECPVCFPVGDQWPVLSVCSLYCRVKTLPLPCWLPPAAIASSFFHPQPLSVVNTCIICLHLPPLWHVRDVYGKHGLPHDILTKNGEMKDLAETSCMVWNQHDPDGRHNLLKALSLMSVLYSDAAWWKAS